MLKDAHQREQATDPCRSFIVQAPAGSGKTELLTQRFLRLLSTVTAPEQIVALTFTRKAASEMRERILLALKAAYKEKPIQSAHQQQTRNYAKKALEQDKRFQWNLLKQPHCLKIMTIDALCQSLHHAIPLLEKHIAYAKVSDNVSSHYFQAARHCIEFALDNPDYKEAIKALLLHVDNRQDRLLELFTQLLANREQWLSALFQAKNQDKIQVETIIQKIEGQSLQQLKDSLPFALQEELVLCARTLAQIENNPDSPRFLLQSWACFSQIDRPICEALCQLLLTGEGHFRKSFDHHVGLHSKSCPQAQYKSLKEASKKLLTALSEISVFQKALTQVRDLPKAVYDAEQWAILQNLFQLLPLLVGHLHLVFAEHNEVDFSAIAQQALMALGEPDEPTDLALYLDHRIHHLLVDEFQDTSIGQFELLARLVHGWQENEGKTLFIVGDPMQSIYRFRQAEVGLFFQAQIQGIGPVKLQTLELSCNFRSSPAIIDWINQRFIGIFPKKMDIDTGAVHFHPSVAVKNQDSESQIQALQLQDKQEEAKALIQIINQELALNKEQNIAILVRSRSHLSHIITLLRQAEIPYQGSDITSLSHLNHLQDVWSFTKALLYPADRLAWLSFLRSPYCGLTLKDLHAIASFHKKNSIYANLLQLEAISDLSAEGKVRAAFIRQVLHNALTKRYESNLSTWLIRTLNQLHLPQILNFEQQQDLEQFWTLIDKHEKNGALANRQEFNKEFDALYSQEATPSRVQIMTIHKSKGLEFDTVILPGLSATPNRKDTSLIRWQDTFFGLLMSPLPGAHHDNNALYQYLGQLDEIKSHYESQRLLYVAATRAKSRLYLLDNQEKGAKYSFRELLEKQEFLSQEALETKEEQEKLPLLARLPASYYTQENVFAHSEKKEEYIAPLMSSEQRIQGVVTHLLLQWIGNNHPSTLADVPWHLADTEFKKLGFNKSMQEEALALLKSQISHFFNDSIGQWLMASHNDERNEYELLVQHEGRLVTRIIDRTFMSDNKRWIIDFKTGKNDEAALKKHQEQLNQYALYLEESTSLPIYCGIYYLATNHWVSWQYEVSSALCL